MSEIELETATEFLTRRRGRVRARWVMAPVALFWVISVAIALSTGREHRPELVPFQFGLYACAAFFVHAYTVAWRSGSIIWRYSALFFATLFYTVLCFLHADDAGAWLIYSETGVTARPPEPRLFVPVTLNAISVVALLVHGFFLGLGSRDPDVPSAAASAAPNVASASPAPPDADPVPPNADPVPPDADPVAPDANPVPPDANPVPPDADPVPPDANPVPPDANPAPPDADPAPPEADPAPPDADLQPPADDASRRRPDDL